MAFKPAVYRITVNLWVTPEPSGSFSDAGTTTVQMEANSKEEALESGQELYPGCRLALVNPEPGEQKG